jgi:hypothetical protein
MGYRREVAMTDMALEFMLRLLRAGYAERVARLYAEAWDDTPMDFEPGSLYMRLRNLDMWLESVEMLGEDAARDAWERDLLMDKGEV